VKIRVPLIFEIEGMLRRNVLIFHSGALGDFVLSWPLALALGRIYAQSRIIYVTASQKGALAERALRLESTDVESGWHHLFSAEAQPPANVLKMLDGSHAIFSFVAAADSAWAANVKKLAPHARLFLIDPNPPAAYTHHASQLLLDQLAPDPIVSTALSQMLKSIADRGLGTPRPTAGPILLHPGAGTKPKCWPRECFIELARKLQSNHREVKFVVGEVEHDRWSETELKSLESIAPVITPKTLVELFTAITQASAYVGNDTGPTHLAAIAGAPTTAIFGPTDPAIWHPLGPKARAIRGEPIETISVDQVIEGLGN
jgi:ADP-heptose:LPS heptosyltransferase